MRRETEEREGGERRGREETCQLSSFSNHMVTSCVSLLGPQVSAKKNVIKIKKNNPETLILYTNKKNKRMVELDF